MALLTASPTGAIITTDMTAHRHSTVKNIYKTAKVESAVKYISLRELLALGRKAVDATLSARTIHFYVQQGVLPRPKQVGLPGGGAQGMYESDCLLRLKAISVLQQLKWPLADIRGALDKTGKGGLLARVRWIVEEHKRQIERKAEERMKKIDGLLEQLERTIGAKRSMESSPNKRGERGEIPSWNVLSKLLGRLVELHEDKAD